MGRMNNTRKTRGFGETIPISDGLRETFRKMEENSVSTFKDRQRAQQEAIEAMRKTIEIQERFYIVSELSSAFHNIELKAKCNYGMEVYDVPGQYAPNLLTGEGIISYIKDENLHLLNHGIKEIKKLIFDDVSQSFMNHDFGVVQKNDPRAKTIANILNYTTGVRKRNIRKLFVPGEEFVITLGNTGELYFKDSILRETYESWTESWTEVENKKDLDPIFKQIIRVVKDLEKIVSM